MMLRARRCVPALMLMLLAQVSPARTAGAQVPMPPPEIQELLAKAGRGEALTPAEQKTLSEWGDAMGEQMQQAAPSQKAAPQSGRAHGTGEPPGKVVTGAEAPSAFNAYDNESSKIESDGLTIWKRDLWPVFSHPRCLNCHGVVNPQTGENHGGGKVPGVAMTSFGTVDNSTPCAGCHTEGARWDDKLKVFSAKRMIWTLPLQEMWFADVSSTELCSRMSQNVWRNPERFFEHFEKDELVRLSFVGLRGMDNRSPTWDVVQPAEPPPMGHSQFLLELRKWALLGAGGCGWRGTITYHQKSITDSSNSAGSYHESHEAHTELTVKTSRASGTVRYADDHTSHAEGFGKCPPTSDSKSSVSGNGTGEGAISVTRRPEGSYSITFPLFRAEETGEESTHDTWLTGCPDPGSQFPDEMRPGKRSDTRSVTFYQLRSEVQLKGGSAATASNHITGRMDDTTTDLGGSKITITATWDLQTP